VIAETTKNHLTEIRRQVHPNCIVCCPGNKRGLQLDFMHSDNGSVVAHFHCDKTLEGYLGLVHGGVISTVLDGAMTNCLFAHGCTAVTADFHIRFRHPVVTEQPASVRAWITRSTPPIYELKAQIIQDDQVKAVATGKFMEKN